LSAILLEDLFSPWLPQPKPLGDNVVIVSIAYWLKLDRVFSSFLFIRASSRGKKFIRIRGETVEKGFAVHTSLQLKDK